MDAAVSVRKIGLPRFVVLKHAASDLLCLEIGGRPKAWTVLKGFPLLKRENRLAIQTDNYPASYFNCEAPSHVGRCGAGTAMVWDTGVYYIEGHQAVRALKSGRLHFYLEGRKLRGNWHLIQLHQSKDWLLINTGDDLSDRSGQAETISVSSQRGMDTAGRQDAPANTIPRIEFKRFNVSSESFKSAAIVSGFCKPMLARSVKCPPVGSDWTYEIKFAGFRAQAIKHGSDLLLLSRNGKDFGTRFSEIRLAVADLDIHDAIIDGEIVALDADGISSVKLLQSFESGAAHPPVCFYVFDLLWMNGIDLKKEPLVKRRAMLQTIIKSSFGSVRFSGSLGENAEELLRQAKQIGLEGLIGKKKDSIYEPGERSGAWIKLKFSRAQGFVID